MNKFMNIEIPVSIGELIDKISILKIKLDQISQPEKKLNIKNELDILNEYYFKIKNEHLEIEKFLNELIKVNLEIWDLQEISKNKIINKELDLNYLEITTQIHNLNDLRFEIKKEINLSFNSEIIEEKSYKKYQ